MVDVPDWVIWGRARKSKRNLKDWIIRGTVARPPGQEQPAHNIKQEPPRPGLDHPGKVPGRPDKIGRRPRRGKRSNDDGEAVVMQ